MIDLRSTAGEVRAAGDFLRGLPGFFRPAVPELDPAPRLAREMNERESAFALLLRRAVFEHPRSPYRALFDRAGVSLDDVTATLETHGVDRTLESLHDAGVYVTLEEFKGRRPIVRRGLEVPVRSADFDNPLSAREYEAQTGGSTGTARPVHVDLALLEHEAAYHARLYGSLGVLDRPFAIWHMAPPGAVGIKTALIGARLGRPVERWFSQSAPAAPASKHHVFLQAARLTASALGTPIPAPTHTPVQAAVEVAQWLAARRAAGAAPVLATTVSGGVRVCAAALDGGIDISGSLFVLVGEPCTLERSALMKSAGVRPVVHYAMVEAGLIGLACLEAEAPDDVHLLSNKVTTIGRQVPVNGMSAQVTALVHTTVLPLAPKVMINVESGDCAVQTARTCSCGLLPPSFGRHAHTIRSYEKLTSEGMHLLGDDLLGLVEQRLPAVFGGRPTDYQFEERQESGLARVNLIVRNEVGRLDEEAVIREVISYVRSRGQGQALMARIWEDSQTLRIVRGDPHVTAGGKIPPILS